MSRSNHTTLKSITRGLSKREIDELFSDRSDDRVDDLLQKWSNKQAMRNNRNASVIDEDGQ